jgi:ribosome-binding protein aMBF1 (putative translation factor)
MSNQSPRRETAGGFCLTRANMKSGPSDANRKVDKSGQCAFAAKVRAGRAVLGWSQTELARRVGLTQRAIHKLEKGDTEPRRKTVEALEEIWRHQNIQFKDRADGGFQIEVDARAFRAVDPGVSRRK